MTRLNEDAAAVLVAKDEIRELALLFARASGRKDFELLRSLYTTDGTNSFLGISSGTVDDFIAYAETMAPQVAFTCDFVCNHLVSLQSETEACGEVYAISYHVMFGAEADSSAQELVLLVRYLDHYRKEDGSWKFASREVAFDYRTERAIPTPEVGLSQDDPSYELLAGQLFARGRRC